MQPNQESLIDLSPFKLEEHVEEALRVALLQTKEPLSAADLLNAAITVSTRTPSSAFSRWASFFPDERQQQPSAPQGDVSTSHLPVNPALAASFEVAKSLFRQKDEIWGRDYITIALLADDPSLDAIAKAGKRSIQGLRNDWYRFVSATSPEHRQWQRWWKALGIPIPEKPENLPNASPAPATRTGTYLLTWNPKRTPVDDIAAAADQLEREGKLVKRWSVGSHGAESGDRVFLMRHGDDQPGMIGAGRIVSDLVEGPHWDKAMPAEWTASYADVQWEVLRPLPLISLPELIQRTGEQSLWTQTGSGLPVPQQLAMTLEGLWKEAVTLQASAAGVKPAPQKAAAAAAGANGAAQQAANAPVVDPAKVEEPKSQQVTPSPAPQKPATPEAAPKPPDTWMLSDRPLESGFKAQDKFEFTYYADALAAIIDHKKTETPFTMAINAPWGAGKTTLGNMIVDELKQRAKSGGRAQPIICWFNAWLHDDAESLASALISEIGRTVNGSRRISDRLLKPLPAALLESSGRTRRRIMIGAPLLLLVIIAGLWVTPHLESLDKHKKWEASKSDALKPNTYQVTTTSTVDASNRPISRSESTTRSKSDGMLAAEPQLTSSERLLDRFQSKVVVFGTFLTLVAGLLGGLTKLLGLLASTSLGALGGFVQSPDKAAEAGTISKARKQMSALISQATWRDNRLIVLVDDIERCKPPRSVDILDAANQLLDSKNVVVIFLGDMAAVGAAVQLKYKDMAEIFVPSTGIEQTGPDRGKEAFGRLYLQKIIQFQFDLPVLPTNKIREYLGDLAVTQESGGRNAGN